MSDQKSQRSRQHRTTADRAEQLALDDLRIAVIGLGYVGLPLAVEFGKLRSVIGFDTSARRIAELRSGSDTRSEISSIELNAASQLSFTSDPADLTSANCFIVAVPTPIDRSKVPDLKPLLAASNMVGRFLMPGGLVIYESTVYPGATEEDCVPELEASSGLVFNQDFFVGYSPERVNPGDRDRRLPTIIKVTSGSTPEVADLVDSLYRQIVIAGTHKAPTIRVAEASKVIENTQRDLNIALINELSIIFGKLGIDTEAVLDAAGTKWNFLPFRPGLVGGHCIGVDPYYLTHKAESLGYHPEIILAGRRLNDAMGPYVASQLVKAMLGRRIHVHNARILIMGLSFKENSTDLRNTRVIDVVSELLNYNCRVDVYDPWASAEDAKNEYDLDLVAEPMTGAYDGIIVAVAHQQFRDLGVEAIRQLGRPDHVLYDLKFMFPASESDMRL